jgi:LuxR family maltose regulon positive regulatory protein
MNQDKKKISRLELNKYLTKAIVLKTKIKRPPLRKQFVVRQALIDNLEANTALPLTLISAPTGCGKSITASQWLNQTKSNYGWLSIDEEHNAFEVLLAYLVTILKEIWPDKSFDTMYLTDAARLTSSLVASTFINDIDRLDEPFILVLDDYHYLKEEKIHAFINELLRYPPNQFHLVIITQIDPPLKLARLRSQFRLNELRMLDLVFTSNDALALQSLISNETSEAEVMALISYAEGWPTGVIAGLMGLAEGIPFEKVAQALQNRGSIISELLDEVVLNGLPERMVKYLEITALLERFSESLIKEMIEATNDQDLRQISPGELIQNSTQKNLFLIQLDSTGEWFRYHHFFKNQITQLIGKHFKPAEIEKLHKAASRWFEENDFLEESFAYALRSGDMNFAISLISRVRHKLINSEQLQRLHRLIQQFPRDVNNNNPELCITMAMLQHYNVNFEGMHENLVQANKLLKEYGLDDASKKQLWGEYHGVSTFMSYMKSDFEKAIEHGEKCMELLPAETPSFYREQSVGWYAFAQIACGNASLGNSTLDREYQTLANANPYFRMRLLQGKLIFNLFIGETTHLYLDGSSLIRVSSPLNYPGSWVIGTYGMAHYSYIYNHLEKVSEFHDELRKYRYVCRPFWVMEQFFVECLSGMAQKSWQKVEHCLAECEALAEELGIEPLKGLVRAFQVEYYLKREELNRASELAVLANFEPHPPTFFYFIPQLTQVKLLLKTKQETKGIVLLENLITFGRSRHNNNLLVQALALHASIFAKQRKSKIALNSLQELLMLTNHSRNIRVYLDCGETMEKLLLKMEQTSITKEQITLILNAFKKEKKQLDRAHSTNKSTQKISVKLSARECEILALVTDGHKNEEIAKKLYISLDTVKKHLYRAYQKLEVNNRVSAIQKVQVLGLIKSH